MPVLKLGRRALLALPAMQKTVIFFDEDLTGFGLKVTAKGARSWIVEYRPGAGGRGVAKRRLVIGTPATLSPEQAREAAETLLARVKLGADPAAERATARRAETVAELLDDYLTDAAARRKARSVALFKMYASKHIRPAIGSRKANALTHGDVGRLHRSIGKTRPVTANRIVAVLHAAYVRAIKTGALPKGTENPAAGIERFREQGRERYLTAEEFQRLGDALREAETVGIPWVPDPNKKTKHAPRPENRRTILDQHAVGAIRLLLLTGCRLREILHLRWNEVDAERGLLFLPDSKSGRKTVVLSTAALAVIESLPRLGVYVIAGESAGQKDERPRADLNKPWRTIRDRAGLDGVRLHDLRHSFASIGAGQGLGLPIVGKLLGHSQTSTTQRYAHLDADPVRRAADLIAERISAAMSGK